MLNDQIKTLYLTGPMRGIRYYNFPAFIEACEQLELKGYAVLCPASTDIAEGFNASKPEDELTTEDMERFIVRDVQMVIESDGVAVLPGFEKSKGAMVEVSLARFLDKPVYRYPDMVLMEDHINILGDSEDVLIEALKLTSGDRQNQYGPPDQDFARTAAMWSALKGVDFTTEEVAAFMICIKLSRNTHQSKRDNWVDMAGYSRCGDICRQEKEKHD
ncbi:hypothetical protein LCGC14_2282260 [marine sediment metagenome]|uniref:DUF6378 domain-containing protein n=1 Tax=marine sediment metagenome TaxID=412755 RepID=A0A0F9F6B5_9ZZZZ